VYYDRHDQQTNTQHLHFLFFRHYQPTTKRIFCQYQIIRSRFFASFSTPPFFGPLSTPISILPPPNNPHNHRIQTSPRWADGNSLRAIHPFSAIFENVSHCNIQFTNLAVSSLPIVPTTIIHPPPHPFFFFHLIFSTPFV
jgi:hypothetical protein